MIASALRADVVRLARTRTDRTFDGEPLARCAAVLQGLTRGAHATATEEPSSSIRTLMALCERGLRDRSAAGLVYRAFSEHLAAELDLPGADRDLVEAAFDELDERVEDPRELPSLREALRVFVAHFDRLCEEATRAPRRSHDLAVTAA
jgi:hypothetical protein